MAGNKCKSGTLSRILLGVFVAMVCVVPCMSETVYSGQTLDLGTGYPDEQIIDDGLDVYGTLNTYAGAYVEYWIDVYPGAGEDDLGAVVNVYDCEIGWWLDVYEPEAPTWLGQPPVVTIYGSKFRVVVTEGLTEYSTEYLPPVDVPISGLLEVLSETNEILFSLIIYSEIEIHLRQLPVIGSEEIPIDIKPGCYPNSINLGSKGLVPVAVLSAGVFDATDVDPDTVDFAGACPVHWAFEDVDGDGDTDMIFHFRTQELVDLDEDSTEAILTGQTFGDTPIQIEASDTVKIVPSKKK